MTDEEIRKINRESMRRFSAEHSTEAKLESALQAAEARATQAEQRAEGLQKEADEFNATAWLGPSDRAEYWRVQWLAASGIMRREQADREASSAIIKSMRDNIDYLNNQRNEGDLNMALRAIKAEIAMRHAKQDLSEERARAERLERVVRAAQKWRALFDAAPANDYPRTIRRFGDIGDAIRGVVAALDAFEAWNTGASVPSAGQEGKP